MNQTPSFIPCLLVKCKGEYHLPKSHIRFWQTFSFQLGITDSHSALPQDPPPVSQAEDSRVWVGRQVALKVHSHNREFRSWHAETRCLDQIWISGFPFEHS